MICPACGQDMIILATDSHDVPTEVRHPDDWCPNTGYFRWEWDDGTPAGV